jgi:hypothetical protein
MSSVLLRVNNGTGLNVPRVLLPLLLVAILFAVPSARAVQITCNTQDRTTACVPVPGVPNTWVGLAVAEIIPYPHRMPPSWNRCFLPRQRCRSTSGLAAVSST